MSGKSRVSRRAFLKAGVAAVGAAVVKVSVPSEAGGAESAPDKVLGPGRSPCALRVNGKELRLNIEPRVTLLRALRNEADYTGAKEACDRGACGACTVLVDNKPVASCMMLAMDAQDKSIVTVEGLASGAQLHPVQEAFKTCDAYQCGYCTPGFILASVALLKEKPAPSLDDIRRGLSGNICRCAAYNHMFDAVRLAAKNMGGKP